MRKMGIVVALCAAVMLVAAMLAASARAADTGIEGNLTYDDVSGWGFAPNDAVVVIVKASQHGKTLYLGTAPTDENGTFMATPGLDLVAGQFVFATDGTTLTGLTLADLTIDSMNAAAGTLTGHAPKGETVKADADVGGAWQGADPVAANDQGVWTADFHALGIDVTVFIHFGASIDDPNGNRTAVDLQISSARIEARGNEISGHGFTPGDSVTVQILNAGGTQLWSGPAKVGVDYWQPDGFAVPPATHGVDLAPGMRILVTDETLAAVYGHDAATKELTIAPLTYDSLDAGTDTASGTAEPFASVGVAWPGAQGGNRDGGDWPTVTADVNGHWELDFMTTYGFDVTPEMIPGEHTAMVGDEDGDSTTARFVRPYVVGDLTSDSVSGEFGDYATLTVKIYDALGGNLLASNTVQTDGNGNYALSRATHHQDLVPGTYITVTNGSVTKTVTLDFLTLDSFSADANAASGRADPGTTVLAGWSSALESKGDGMNVVADPSGAWHADFTSIGNDMPLDAVCQARVFDSDGDATAAELLTADTTKPTVTDDYDDLWHNAPVLVTLDPQDTGGSGVDTTYYLVDGDPLGFHEGISFTVSGEGQHAVEYYTTDRTGNESDHHTITVKIDTTKPVTADNTAGAWHAVPFALALAPTDALSGMSGGQAETQYSTDGGATWQTGTSLAFTARWKRGGGSGTYPVLVMSTDAAGNTETPHTVNVMIDTSAPTSSDDASTTPVAGPVTVHLTGQDSFSGVAFICYALDGGSWTQVAYPGGAGLPVIVTGAGSHTLRYYAIDGAGNLEAGYRVCTVTIADGGDSAQHAGRLRLLAHK